MEDRDGWRGEESRSTQYYCFTFHCSLYSPLFNLFLLFTVRYGQGTRDMAGPSGLTTEAFINKVRQYVLWCGMLWSGIAWYGVVRSAA